MYRLPDSFYLILWSARNHPDVSYAQVLRQEKQIETGQNSINFKNKAVFIGHSDQVVPNKKDGFYTVFSQSSGIDISGVEMAATAFANFVETCRSALFPRLCGQAIIVVCGVIPACICIFLRPGFAIFSILGMGIVYASYILFRFTFGGHWYPLVIPLFFNLFWHSSAPRPGNMRISGKTGRTSGVL